MTSEVGKRALHAPRGCAQGQPVAQARIVDAAQERRAENGRTLAQINYAVPILIVVYRYYALLQSELTISVDSACEVKPAFECKFRQMMRSSSCAAVWIKK